MNQENQDNQVHEDTGKTEDEAGKAGEEDTGVVLEDHPPGASVVGDGGGYPQYRHARQTVNRTVEHPLGDQPEGVVEDPVVYPPDQLPPSLETPPEEPPPPPPSEGVKE